MVEVVPYQDHPTAPKSFERTFPSDVQESELVWHRDYATRKITVVQGDGWQFQLDNQMPQMIQPGDSWCVPAGVYHRIIRGCDDLVLSIQEI
jgi:quercetin dioxygenase-like cupin family protein